MVHGLETLKRLNEEQKAKEEAMATAALHEYFARLDREREEAQYGQHFSFNWEDEEIPAPIGGRELPPEQIVSDWVSNHVISRTRPDILQFIEYCYDGDIVSQITIDLDRLCVLLYNPETERREPKGLRRKPNY